MLKGKKFDAFTLHFGCIGVNTCRNSRNQKESR